MRLFRNMAIRGKLLLASGAIVLLSGIVGFVALTINSAIRIDISQIRQDIAKPEGVAVMAESLLTLKLHRQELLAEKHRAIHNSAQAPESPDLAKITQAVAETIKQFEGGLAACHNRARRSLELSKQDGHADEIDDAKLELLMIDGI